MPRIGLARLFVALPAGVFICVEQGLRHGARLQGDLACLGLPAGRERRQGCLQVTSLQTLLQALRQVIRIFQCLAGALARGGQGGVGGIAYQQNIAAVPAIDRIVVMNGGLAQGNLVHVKLDLDAMPLDVVACYPSHRHLAAKTRALLALLQQRLPGMVKMAA